MTMPVAGNAVVANFLMRFPVLIPVAAAVVVTTAVVVPPAAPPVSPPVVQKVEVAPPPPPVLVVPKPVEVLCPPIEKTAKLHAKEKQALRAKGCKVKG
jgi:hypothetical protein